MLEQASRLIPVRIGKDHPMLCFTTNVVKGGVYVGAQVLMEPNVQPHLDRVTIMRYDSCGECAGSSIFNIFLLLGEITRIFVLTLTERWIQARPEGL